MPSSLADDILRLLLQSAEKPVSGQDLARRLGVTRAAVWKGIEALRASGYPVGSVTARGYLLEVERATGLRPGELDSRLETRRLGRPIRHLETVDSTNREAERWAQERAPEGALVVAEHQEEGRGRLGRAWYDRPRRGLLFSVVLRPSLPAAQTPTVTFAAAAGLLEALERWVAPEHMEVKWPNDVLLDGRKVAGILLEMRCQGQEVEHVVLGVGVNVEGSASEFPEDLQGSLTTVHEHSRVPVRRQEVLCAFLQRFEDRYDELLRDGFGALRPRWNRWFRMMGQRLRVRGPQGETVGIARGLGSQGALLLEQEDGRLATILAGDVERSTTR